MIEPKMISVIANTGYLEISIDNDNDSGRIANKERITDI